MDHRFARTELVLGAECLTRLASKKVAVVGVGGVGGYVVEALARSAIGALVLVDYDLVSITNLNRQIIALESTIGQAKVDVMAQRVLQINPDCKVSVHRVRYEKSMHQELIPANVDLIADAIDSVGAKADLIESAMQSRVPIISSLGAGNKLDPTYLEITDISKTHTCPLARAVRAALRKRGIFQGVPVVFSKEPPAGKGEGSVPGSTAFVPPAAGLLMASWIVRQICKEARHGPI
ncbi:MAG TPA: hypothetical protein DDW87_02520 [Firmicutes bacterium]|nr:hypothetical protein [Bacillota bacterium]